MSETNTFAERMQLVSHFIDELVTALVNRRIYWEDHPRMQRSLQDVIGLLQEYTGLTKEPALVLGIAGDCLVVSNRPLMGASMSSTRILHPMQALGAGGLKIGRASSSEDFLSLVNLLTKDHDGRLDYQKANKVLKSEGCREISFLAPYDPAEQFIRSEEKGSPIGNQFHVPVRIYQDVVNHLQNVTIAVCQGSYFSMDSSRAHVESVLERLRTDAKTMMSLARYEQYDAFTFGHSVRVCYLAVNFAKSLTSNADSLNRIGLAALLHDVGKSKIPFEILHSSERLTVEERREMEKHAAIGAEILTDIDDPDPVAVAAAFGHHKTNNYDGYPRTVHQSRQSKVTKIVKICDVYEALTATRPYKPSMTPAHAYRIMLSMKNHFEPGLLRRFIESNGIYPVGTRVLLSTGEIASVHDQTKNIERPKVMLETTPDGDELGADEGEFVDLSEADPEIEVKQLIMESSQS
ncbi:MAG: HD-GYP domain-containing protein [Planctomycetota bacterium]